MKEEVRRNAVARIRAGEPLVDAVLGYEDTVLPQLENAILAGHDVIFLGERGQAKTRMIRSLTGLLDEWMPIVAGCEINDDPYAPVSRHARELVAEKGDDTPIDWVHRDDRFGEKLATPDTSIADLIGEVDPIKVAEGRYLSDELTLHYGLVPRTNRGIFAINELPDLAERIQVGLLNVLEERDVQIRGYKVRLPLDVMLFASANPEDYTNRGRIITPLKDRFGAQIRTHYPLEVETEMAIVEQEARPLDRRRARGRSARRSWPRSWPPSRQLARQSPHINQRSGVSVRLTVSNLETLVANAARRALRAGETEVVPRVSATSRPWPRPPSGKVEIESLEDDGGEIVERLVQPAVLTGVPRPARRRRAARRASRRSTTAGSSTPARTWPPPTRSALADRGPGPARAGRRPGRRRRAARPWWPAPSSSSSRACTSPSASTRTPTPGTRATYRAR